MIIPGQVGFNCPSGFREEAFWNIFPIGSNVKLSPAVAAILNFISDLKFGLLQLLELRSINKIAIIWWLTYKK